jgi:hypothetical protein
MTNTALLEDGLMMSVPPHNENVSGHLELVDSFFKTPVIKPLSMWDMTQSSGKDRVHLGALGIDGALTLTFF